MLNTYRYLELMYAAADSCISRMDKSDAPEKDSLLSPMRNGTDNELIDSVDELRYVVNIQGA